MNDTYDMYHKGIVGQFVKSKSNLCLDDHIIVVF